MLEVTQRFRSSGAATRGSTLLDLTALALPVLHATLAQSLYADRLFTVTITNVPGPEMPLYALAGLPADRDRARPTEVRAQV
jgi:hypothetical protein